MNKYLKSVFEIDSQTDKITANPATKQKTAWLPVKVAGGYAVATMVAGVLLLFWVFRDETLFKIAVVYLLFLAMCGTSGIYVWRANNWARFLFMFSVPWVLAIFLSLVFAINDDLLESEGIFFQYTGLSSLVYTVFVFILSRRKCLVSMGQTQWDWRRRGGLWMVTCLASSIGFSASLFMLSDFFSWSLEVLFYVFFIMPLAALHYLCGIIAVSLPNR